MHNARVLGAPGAQLLKEKGQCLLVHGNAQVQLKTPLATPFNSIRQPKTLPKEEKQEKVTTTSYVWQSLPLQELVSKHVSKATKDTGKFVTLKQLSEFLAKKSSVTPNKIMLGRALAMLGYKRHQVRKGGKQVWGVYLKFKK